MISDEILKLTALELANLYGSKQISPIEATRAVLDQISRHNGALNCICSFDEDATMAMAGSAEERWLRGQPLSPIDGVPVTIKDLTLTKGWPTLRGSRTTDNSGPWDEDAPATARLRESGAVLVGKTTTPEFGWKGVTDSPLTGVTRNPWDYDCTPGGSSGGAAAAAAAFMGPLHQGSDAAGSIRIPAAFTGVFGHKPTFGLVPHYPLPAHIGTLMSMGPITRCVKDAAAMLNVLAQPDHRDFMAAPASAQHVDYLEKLDGSIDGVRIAYSRTLGPHGWCDDDVATAVERAAGALADLGAIVEEADPNIPSPQPIIEVLWATADAWLVAQIPEEKRELMDNGLLSIAQKGVSYSSEDVIDANVQRIELGTRMARFHESYDLLLTPQMPLEAIKVGQNFPDSRNMTEWIDWSPFTYPFNLTMQPACSVPCGLGSRGLPVAFQLVGRHFEDALLLRVARAYEQANPFAPLPFFAES
jgi:aspartyl-tRNA(Asn)/glutamyl-tRNA(Gln) amidotransferase subunit A